MQDAISTYSLYLETVSELKKYQGSMRWKKIAGKDYLYKLRDGRGNGKSLGPRSTKTESTYDAFRERKQFLKGRKQSLGNELKKQAKFCIAAQVNRVPKLTANILRLLDDEGLLGNGIVVLGTNAIYAYEAMAGVFLNDDVMETKDVDLLLDARIKLKLSSEIKTDGMIGLLHKIDKSFVVHPKGYFSASNDKGYSVELVKPVPHNPFVTENNALSDNNPDDLFACEMDGFEWLKNAPKLWQTVIAEDGFPLRMCVPDPRFFALNKIWMSNEQSRNPLKRGRDKQQGLTIAEISRDFLNLDFNDKALRVFPEEVRKLVGPDANEAKHIKQNRKKSVDYEWEP